MPHSKSLHPDLFTAVEAAQKGGRLVVIFSIVQNVLTKSTGQSETIVLAPSVAGTVASILRYGGMIVPIFLDGFDIAATETGFWRSVPVVGNNFGAFRWEGEYYHIDLAHSKEPDHDSRRNLVKWLLVCAKNIKNPLVIYVGKGKEDARAQAHVVNKLNGYAITVADNNPGIVGDATVWLKPDDWVKMMKTLVVDMAKNELRAQGAGSVKRVDRGVTPYQRERR